MHYCHSMYGAKKSRIHYFQLSDYINKVDSQTHNINGLRTKKRKWYEFNIEIFRELLYSFPSAFVLWQSKLTVLWFQVTLHTMVDYYYIYLFSLSAFSGAAPVAYGGFQARGQIRAEAAGLHHSHSNSGSQPRLQRTPQLTATPAP